MAIKQYPGAAEQLTLNANINNSVTTFVVTETPTSAWPTAGNQYVISIRKTDDTNEEKILCNGTSRSASNFSSVTRGFDGTTAVSHTAGEIVRVVWDAASATDASRHIYTTTDDDHAQYLNTTRHDVTARHAFGAALGTPAAAADVSTSAGAGSSGVPARSDHFHKVGTGAINSAGMFAAGVVDAAAIGTDAVGSAEIAPGAVGLSEVADGSVDTAAIVDGNVTEAKLAANIISTGDLKWSAQTANHGNWLKCEGAAVSRTGANAALFALIGTAFGVGDGSTTFNLPDARGRTMIATGTGSGLTARALGAATGTETHTLTAAQIPDHDHPLDIEQNGYGGGIISAVAAGMTGSPSHPNYGGGGSQTPIKYQSEANGQSHQNMQPCLPIGSLFIHI